MQFKSVVAASLALVAARAQSNDTSMMNLTSLIGSQQELSGLSTLLSTYPSIGAALANATNITVFAPNNKALQAISSALGSTGGIDTNLVNHLFDYYVVPGMFYASNITETPQFPHTTLNNTDFTNVTGGQVVECRLMGMTAQIISGLKTTANVTTPNLNFTGGVVHIVDNVLTIPANLSTTAGAANLTALVGATEATNLTSTLEGLKDITIFAPSNEAFQAIGSAAANLTMDQAAKILEYHVINGTIAYSSSLANATIPTLGGGNVTISIQNGSVFVNSARVINADVLLANGVMHVIDSVLNPNNTNATADASATTAVPAFSDASSATDVPFTSGVPAPKTTIVNLVTTITQVAEGYSTQVAAGGAMSSTLGSAGAASSTKSGGAAAVQTGAMGAAALFGGAALLANM